MMGRIIFEITGIAADLLPIQALISDFIGSISDSVFNY
jgi:hypothetical protein